MKLFYLLCSYEKVVEKSNSENLIVIENALTVFHGSESISFLDPKIWNALPG